jgi:peptidoglycan/LPS O-acetylase OafA/YrhL
VSSLGYRPAIDGLRAVAIVPVILFHLGFAWLPGGFLGVDVFFVISGYLIGSMIAAELDAGRFSFGKFWARRVRRIMPALLAMVLSTLLAARQLVTNIELGSIGWDSLAASLSFANIWMFSKVGNYWGSAAESSPFLHAWSLSVEEQFYLVFPVFLVLLVRLKLDRGRALLVALALAFLLFVVASAHNPTLSFYLLPTRAWELLTGAVTAAVGPRFADRLSPRLQAMASGVGLVLIAGSLFLMDGRRGIGWSVAVPALGTALVLLYSARASLANAWLRLRPVVFVGKISYSLYLWHWAIIILAGMLELQRETPVPMSWVVGAIAAAALLSYYLIEKPSRASPKGVWVAAALLVVVTGLSCVFIKQAAAFEASGAFNPVVAYSAYYDMSPIKDERVQLANTNPNDAALGMWAGVVGKVPNPKWADAYENGGIPGGTRAYGEPADLLLVGDSHGCMWGKTVDEVASDLGLGAAFFTFDGNVPYFPIPIQAGAAHGSGFTDETFQRFSSNLLKNIDAWKPRVLILVSRWEDKSSKDFYNAAALADYATKAGAKLLFINNPPLLPWVNNSTTQSLELRGMKAVAGQPQYVPAKKPIKKVEQANQRLQQLASQFPGARVLDVYTPLHKDDQVQVLDGRNVLYLDDDHLTYQGTSLFKAALTSELSELLKPP